MKKSLIAFLLLASVSSFAAETQSCLSIAEQTGIALFKVNADPIKVLEGFDSTARLEDTYGEYSDYVVGVSPKTEMSSWAATYLITVQSTAGGCEVVYSQKLK